MNKSEHERLAIVELKVDILSKEQTKHTDALNKLTAAINKFNGRWGLIIMVGSAMLYILTYFKVAIVKIFTGG